MSETEREFTTENQASQPLKGINTFNRPVYKLLYKSRLKALQQESMKASVSVSLSFLLMAITTIMIGGLALISPILAGIIAGPWALFVSHFSFKGGTLLGSNYGFYMGIFSQVPKELLESEEVMLAIGKAIDTNV